MTSYDERRKEAINQLMATKSLSQAAFKMTSEALASARDFSESLQYRGALENAEVQAGRAEAYLETARQSIERAQIVYEHMQGD